MATTVSSFPISLLQCYSATPSTWGLITFLLKGPKWLASLIKFNISDDLWCLKSVKTLAASSRNSWHIHTLDTCPGTQLLSCYKPNLGRWRTLSLCSTPREFPGWATFSVKIKNTLVKTRVTWSFQRKATYSTIDHRLSWVPSQELASSSSYVSELPWTSVSGHLTTTTWQTMEELLVWT